MNQDEHQRERMRLWIDVAGQLRGSSKADYIAASLASDNLLAEFDKRFPAPAAVDTDRERRENLHCVISDLTDQCREANTELAALREKARLWDAVGKLAAVENVEGHGYRVGFGTYKDFRWTDWHASAEEAVQAAIDEGALK